MIRKMFALLCALVLLASCACAEEAVATTYTIDEIGVSVTLPADFNIVLTRNMSADDDAFALLGITKEQVDELMIGMNSHLDAMIMTDLGITHELVLTCVETPILDSLSDIPDDEMEGFVEGLKIPYAEQGITVASYETLQLDDQLYLLLYESTTNGYVGIQCMAIENGSIYNLTLTCYLGTITEADALMVAEMLDAMVIVK